MSAPVAYPVRFVDNTTSPPTPKTGLSFAADNSSGPGWVAGSLKLRTAPATTPATVPITGGTGTMILEHPGGQGFYWVLYDPLAAGNGEAAGVLDGGVSLPAGDRYQPVLMTADSGLLQSAIGAATGQVVASSVQGNVNGNLTGNVAGSVGSVTGPVGSVTGAVGSVAGNVAGSVASVAGTVGSVAGGVAGDVAGRVLGGGGGTITGDGVRASSVTGPVGSVTGAVGSVAGNVGGNVVGSAASVTAPVAASLIATGLDNVNQVDGFTVRGLLSLLLAMVAGQSSGASLTSGPKTITFEDPSGNVTRVVISTDGNGNRIHVTTTPAA